MPVRIGLVSNQASSRAIGYASQPQFKLVNKLLAECRVVLSIIAYGEELSQNQHFIMIQFYDVGAFKRSFDPLARIEILAKIDIKNPQRAFASCEISRTVVPAIRSTLRRQNSRRTAIQATTP